MRGILDLDSHRRYRRHLADDPIERQCVAARVKKIRAHFDKPDAKPAYVFPLSHWADPAAYMTALEAAGFAAELKPSRELATDAGDIFVTFPEITVDRPRKGEA